MRHEDLQGTDRAENTINPQIAGGGTVDHGLHAPAHPIEILAFYLAAGAAVTGVVTNHVTVQLIDAGPAGTGSTVIASITFDSGTDLVANVLTQIGAALAVQVAKNSLIKVRYLDVGTGMVLPSMVTAIDWRYSHSVTN